MTEIEKEMVRLQELMEINRLREVAAFEAKQKAERTLDECRSNWISINKEYQNCREKLNASKIK